MSVSVWEAVFMLVVLKIPVIYLAAVVWWAVRAEPTGEVGGDEAGVLTPLPSCGWDDWKRRRARMRGGRPSRPPGRVALRARVS